MAHEATQRDQVNALAFSPDGNWLASAGYRQVKLWHRMMPVSKPAMILPTVRPRRSGGIRCDTKGISTCAPVEQTPTTKEARKNGAAVVDSSGQSYQSALADTAAGCTSFPGTENIAPGSSGLGCIVFEVPKAAKIVSVQFTLDSGMGPETGQWNVG